MASKFELTINTDNAAFQDGSDGAQHVAELLREVADHLEERGGFPLSDKQVTDSNGNKVGYFRHLTFTRD